MKRELGIHAYKCKKCGRLHYPFHDRCLACRSRDYETVKPQATPRLLTFTRIYNLPWGIEGRYLIIGVVEFENGVKAMGQIPVDEKEPLANGMLLHATWEPVRVQWGECVWFGIEAGGIRRTIQRESIPPEKNIRGKLRDRNIRHRKSARVRRP